MSVINRILNLMEKENINARKLTTDLGLSNSCITEWKKGKAKPSIEAVVKIASYFGVTTDFLLLEQTKTELLDFKKEEKQKIDNNMESNCQRIQEVPQELVSECADEQDTLIQTTKIRNHRERNTGYLDNIRYSVELSGEEKRLLDSYLRLTEADKEYIRCKIIVLEWEAAE